MVKDLRSISTGFFSTLRFWLQDYFGFLSKFTSSFGTGFKSKIIIIKKLQSNLKKVKNDSIRNQPEPFYAKNPLKIIVKNIEMQKRNSERTLP